MKITSTIDAAGRLVIPKPLRKQYAMDPGQTILFVEESEGLLITAEQSPRRFIKEGPITAIDTGAGTAPSSLFDVSEVREEHLERKSRAHRRG